MAAAIKLVSGAAMPLVGLGTWKIGRDVVAAAVTGAIRAGYRHIDCAADYGNEREVGAGIRAAIAEGLVTRADLWVTSKLWNTCHAPEHVRAACERTLADLGLEYLDLYLVHFPIAMAFVPFDVKYPAESPRDASGAVQFAKVPLHRTWAALEALHDAGLVRHLGVSNFNAQLLLDLLSYSRVPPAVNQVEMHPYLTQRRLVAFCHAHHVAVTAYSPFGGSSYVELGSPLATNGPTPLLQHDAVAAIAAAHGKTPAQVLLRWAVQQNVVVVPKSMSVARQVENAALFDFALTADEMAALGALHHPARYNDPIDFWGIDIHA